MSSFSRALEDYHDGTGSESAVVAQLEWMLADARSDPDTLLTIIDEHHAQRPLPDALVTRLRARVHEAAQALTTGGGGSDATRLATGVAEDPRRRSGSARMARPDDATMIAPGPARERVARVGDTLNGRFHLEQLIGEGGMSLVFRAVDRLREKAESRNPYVAVKVLDVVGPSERDAYIALQREAQKCQSLNHPHIVRVHEFHQDGDVVYMTMEYLSGVPLSTKLKQMGQDGLPCDQAMKYINQMGDALIHAHGHRILHADFKPSNVLVTEDDVVKVIDFGIARAFRLPEDNDESKTRFHVQKLGALTPMYASAEMIENAEPDPRDDVYSLACVAYELLTGRHPFARTQATAARDAQLSVRRPRGLKRRQWRALRHGLAFEREDRTPNVRAFLDELNPPRATRSPTFWAGLSAAAAVLLGLAWWAARVEPPLPQLETRPEVTERPPATRVPAPPVEAPLPEPGTLLQDCPECPRLVVLPAGTAVVGAEAAGETHGFESPPLSVTLARPIALGVTEVTRAEFAAYVEDSGSPSSGCRTADSGWEMDGERSWRSPGFDQGADHPVTCVSWLDAQAYLAWLSRRTGERYRLPSETEWEYAARAAGTVNTGLRDHPASACEVANVADESAAERFPGLTVFPCRDGFAATAPAASSAANGFGLHDMLGNVFEWTQDCWNPSYEGTPTDGSARETGDCNKRVLRGGSWFTAPSEQRLTFRNRFDASYRSHTFGFRVAREVGQ